MAAAETGQRTTARISKDFIFFMAGSLERLPCKSIAGSFPANKRGNSRRRCQDRRDSESRHLKFNSMSRPARLFHLPAEVTVRLRDPRLRGRPMKRAQQVIHPAQPGVAEFSLLLLEWMKSGA